MSHLKIIPALWTTNPQRQPADISSVYAAHKNSAAQKNELRISRRFPNGMTDMKEQDAGLVVTCVKPLYCPGANEGNLGETIRTTKISNLLTAPRLSVTTEETAK
jgi:hypothetical protein